MDRGELALRGHADGCVLEVQVRPSSSRRGLQALPGGGFRVFVHSPAVKGKANREALEVLSAALGVAPSRLELIKGQRSRTKLVLAHGLSPHAARERLGVPLPPLNIN